MALLEKDIVVKTSTIPNSGNGLFAKNTIPKGARIVEYKGRVSTWKKVRHENGENGYIYFLNRNHVIDASRAEKSLARYSNDATGLRRIKGLNNNAEYVEDGTRVFIVAKREILSGEEIFVGYGKEYWQTIRENIRIEASNKKIEAKKLADRTRRETLKAAKLAKRTAAVAQRKAKRQETAARKKAKLRELMLAKRERNAAVKAKKQAAKAARKTAKKAVPRKK
ncbi:MAG: SET domain-containing protein [Chitinophagaceae bacterium]|nr:MAG: SET domain-containing protein [Chitinophagaceae bacterium]